MTKIWIPNLAAVATATIEIPVFDLPGMLRGDTHPTKPNGTTIETGYTLMTTQQGHYDPYAIRLQHTPQLRKGGATGAVATLVQNCTSVCHNGPDSDNIGEVNDEGTQNMQVKFDAPGAHHFQNYPMFLQLAFALQALTCSVAKGEDGVWVVTTPKQDDVYAVGDVIPDGAARALRVKQPLFPHKWGG